MIYKVYLGLGSNIGNREKNLSEAIDKINEIDDIEVKIMSKIYETEPVGYLNQGDFLNLVILIATDKSPEELLKSLQKIEEDLKRVREIHWGPRTIDIDILLIENLNINLPELIVPHPRMFERAFVLIPLKDVYVQEGISIKDIDASISNCSDRYTVKLYKSRDLIK